MKSYQIKRNTAYKVVAPARGRGLKLASTLKGWEMVERRPRKGAWIEIPSLPPGCVIVVSPPQGGVD